MKNKSILIQDSDLSIDRAYQFILDDQGGGNALFIGTIRNYNLNKDVKSIDFDAYDAMAIKEMDKIADEAKDKYDILKILIHHRKGHVGVRDIAVIIAISSVHRDTAFDACRFAIDELKSRVPIWKKEFFTDGNHWVNARP